MVLCKLNLNNVTIKTSKTKMVVTLIVKLKKILPAQSISPASVFYIWTLVVLVSITFPEF